MISPFWARQTIFGQLATSNSFEKFVEFVGGVEIGFEFADLACGEPVVPDTAGHEQARADLERIYGDHTRVAREPEDRLQVNQ